MRGRAGPRRWGPTALPVAANAHDDPRTQPEISLSAQRILVAFASRSGSTAGIAQAIADVLQGAGMAVDTQPAGEVTDVTPYTAVVLGSGVFLPHRRSDGGGFLLRHAPALASRAVWLYCAGPIGRGRAGNGAGPDGSGDCNVAEVARAVAARGSAVFGTPVPALADDPLAQLTPVDLARVRSWASEIATELAEASGSAIQASPASPAVRAGRRRGRSTAAPAG